MSNIQADDLTNSVSKLVELNQQIKEARSDIKVLSQAEKALKLHIKKLMVDNGLDVINTKTGKITVKKSVRKVGLNKDTIREGLAVFFEGNDQQAETALRLSSRVYQQRKHPPSPSLDSKRKLLNNGLESVRLRGDYRERRDYESDNENYDNDYEHTIEEWELVYSDELRHMWNTMNTLFYDAGIEHSENFVILLNFAISSMTRSNLMLGSIRSRRDGMKTPSSRVETPDENYSSQRTP